MFPDQTAEAAEKDKQKTCTTIFLWHPVPTYGTPLSSKAPKQSRCHKQFLFEDGEMFCSPFRQSTYSHVHTTTWRAERMKSPEETSARLPHSPDQPRSKNTQGLMEIRL